MANATTVATALAACQAKGTYANGMLTFSPDPWQAFCSALINELRFNGTPGSSFMFYSDNLSGGQQTTYDGLP